MSTSKDLKNYEENSDEYCTNIIKDELQYENTIKAITDIKRYCNENALQICEHLDLEMFEYFISYIKDNN